MLRKTKFIVVAAALGGAVYYMNHNHSPFPQMGKMPSFGTSTSANTYLATPYKGSVTTNIGMGGIGAVGGQYSGPLTTRSISDSDTPKIDATPLIVAAASGDKPKVAKLLKTLPVDGRDSNRRTALMGAAYYGYNEVCEQLLAAGANINLQDNQGFSALDFAAARGLVATVQWLLRDSESKDYKYTVEYATLMRAAFASDISLLPAGKNKLHAVNRISPEGKSPLHVAASLGAVELARTLIERGASVDLPNADNQKPLHWAAWNNQLFMMSLLIKQGADINAIDNAGNTPLIFAAESGHHEAVALLLEKGANKKLRNKARQTAADIAKEKAYTDIEARLNAK